MQSILAISPTKTSLGENKNETKISEDVAINSKGENASSSFSSLLDSFTEKKSLTKANLAEESTYVENLEESDVSLESTDESLELTDGKNQKEVVEKQLTDEIVDLVNVDEDSLEEVVEKQLTNEIINPVGVNEDNLEKTVEKQLTTENLHRVKDNNLEKLVEKQLTDENLHQVKDNNLEQVVENQLTDEIVHQVNVDEGNLEQVAEKQFTDEIVALANVDEDNLEQIGEEQLTNKKLHLDENTNLEELSETELTLSNSDNSLDTEDASSTDLKVSIDEDAQKASSFDSVEELSSAGKITAINNQANNQKVDELDDKVKADSDKAPSSETAALNKELKAIKKELDNGATVSGAEVAEKSKPEENGELLLSDQEPMKAEADNSSKTISPILAQIEAAQKVDTKVSELKNAEKTSISLEASDKKSNKSTSILEKFTKLTPENVLADEMPEVKEGAANKLNNIALTSAVENDKPTFSIAQETSNLRTTSPDKLLNQINQSSPQVQSSALQQPIEVQSKQAHTVMGERIMMMINQGKQEVTIRLDPAELGSMNIKLHIQQDQLQVSIQTQIGQSRDIIEQNLPRLREQLAQQGINLGEANVEQQNHQGQSQSQHSSTGGVNSQTVGNAADTILDEQSEWISTQIPLPAQGIDYYA